MKLKEFIFYIVILAVAIAYNQHRTAKLLDGVSDAIYDSLSAGVELGYVAYKNGYHQEDIQSAILELKEDPTSKPSNRIQAVSMVMDACPNSFALEAVTCPPNCSAKVCIP